MQLQTNKHNYKYIDTITNTKTQLQIHRYNCKHTNTITNTSAQLQIDKQNYKYTNKILYTQTEIQIKTQTQQRRLMSWINIFKLPPSSSPELQPLCFLLKQPVQKKKQSTVYK